MILLLQPPGGLAVQVISVCIFSRFFPVALRGWKGRDPAHGFHRGEAGLREGKGSLWGHTAGKRRSVMQLRPRLWERRQARCCLAVPKGRPARWLSLRDAREGGGSQRHGRAGQGETAAARKHSCCPRLGGHSHTDRTAWGQRPQPLGSRPWVGSWPSDTGLLWEAPGPEWDTMNEQSE